MHTLNLRPFSCHSTLSLGGVLGIGWEGACVLLSICVCLFAPGCMKLESGFSFISGPKECVKFSNKFSKYIGGVLISEICILCV